MLVLKKYKIERPKMVEIYNSNMGGVDVCHMMLSTYRIRQKLSKCYIHIICYCIGTSITNSWLIHHIHIVQQNIAKNQQYTLFLFQSLIGSHKHKTYIGRSEDVWTFSKLLMYVQFTFCVYRVVLPSQRKLRDSQREYKNYTHPNQGFNHETINELENKINDFSNIERFIVIL